MIDLQDILDDLADYDGTTVTAYAARVLAKRIAELEAEAKDGFDQLAVSQREVAELEAKLAQVEEVRDTIAKQADDLKIKAINPKANLTLCAVRNSLNKALNQQEES